MNRILLFFFKIYIYILSVLYNIGFCFWLLYYFSCFNRTRKPREKKVREKAPAILLDPVWGKHGFAQLEEVNIHYVENGDRSKPLMLFIHGFPEFWYSWRYQLKEFSKEYWTVAMDLRGYGYSDRPTAASNYKMCKIMEDIRQLILYFGRTSAILVAHDWGGLILWNFMDKNPNMVERFVVMNTPYHRNFFKTLVFRPTQFIKSWYCFFFQMPYLPEFALQIDDFLKFDLEMKSSSDSAITDEDLEVFKYMFGRPDALRCGINYYRTNCGVACLDSSLPTNYPKGLMLYGENDGYLETRFLKAAQKELIQLRTYIVKDANHFVQQDNPTKVNLIIDAFLKDLPFPKD